MSLPTHTHPLWSDGSQAHGPSVTPALVAEFQAQTGFALPASLVASLQRCNGGRLRRNHLPAFRPTARWKKGLVVHGLMGLGYPEGLDWSATLIAEWGFVSPALVLCHGGPWAVLLDYRRCSAEGEPAVVFCDTDHEVAGRPAEWTIAPSFAAFEAQLEHLADRTRVAVAGDHSAETILAALRAAGAEDPVRGDYEGGHTLTLVGPDSVEPGPARLRALPNRRADGLLALPELPEHGWIVETTVSPPALEDHLRVLADALPGAALLLHRVG